MRRPSMGGLRSVALAAMVLGIGTPAPAQGTTGDAGEQRRLSPAQPAASRGHLDEGQTPQDRGRRGDFYLTVDPYPDAMERSPIQDLVWSYGVEMAARFGGSIGRAWYHRLPRDMHALGEVLLPILLGGRWAEIGSAVLPEGMRYQGSGEGGGHIIEAPGSGIAYRVDLRDVGRVPRTMYRAEILRTDVTPAGGRAEDLLQLTLRAGRPGPPWATLLYRSDLCLEGLGDGTRLVARAGIEPVVLDRPKGIQVLQTAYLALVRAERPGGSTLQPTSSVALAFEEFDPYPARPHRPGSMVATGAPAGGAAEALHAAMGLSSGKYRPEPDVFGYDKRMRINRRESPNEAARGPRWKIYETLPDGDRERRLARRVGPASMLQLAGPRLQARVEAFRQQHGGPASR